MGEWMINVSLTQLVTCRNGHWISKWMRTNVHKLSQLNKKKKKSLPLMEKVSKCDLTADVMLCWWCKY